MNILLNGDMSEAAGTAVSTTPQDSPLNNWQIFTSQGAFSGSVVQGDFDSALKAFVLRIGAASLPQGEVTIRQRLTGAEAAGLAASPLASFAAYLLHGQETALIKCQMAFSRPTPLGEWQLSCLTDPLPAPPNAPVHLAWGELNIGDTSYGLQVDLRFQWSGAQLAPGVALFANFILAPVPQ